ncbi:MAG: UDP-2,3-diacylglucosamine diphosphatase [Saprospiraceae bacterium]|nr:UDP-2,3-diacylglucosamine diphosphatase [Saprospiraceae bacterium]
MKIYFASDFHLGLDGRLTSKEREVQLVRWLDQVSADATEIYLVGDLFDFWFEYKAVVPKGFVRFLGKLAQLRDDGIPIYVFTGNHDMWLFDYLTQELNIPVFREPIWRTFLNARFYIGHGDGLGPGDHGYKFLKKLFASKSCQWFFARLHPNFAFWLANFWSNRSRLGAKQRDNFRVKDEEWLVQYSNDILAEEEVDYFIFGHRHLPIDCLLSNERSRYINLGDWIEYNSYAVFDGEKLELKFFENDEATILSI